MISDPPIEDRAAGLPGAVPERGRDRGRGRRTSTATAATSASRSRAATTACRRRAAGRGSAVRQRGAAAARDAPGVPGARAAARRNVPCSENRPPNAQQRQHGSRAVKRAILTHRRDFVAIAALSSRPSLVAGLHPAPPAVVHVRARATTRSTPSSPRPRRSPPARASRSTIAGVQVGQVGGVEAPERPGRRDDEHRQAVRADLPQRDRAAAAAHAAEGHVPVAGSRARRPRARSRPAASSALASTSPDIDVDQILSSLDADTRNYLLLLLAGGAQAFREPGHRRSTRPSPIRGRRPARDVQAVRAAEPRHARRSRACSPSGAQNIMRRRSTTSTSSPARSGPSRASSPR